MAKKQFKTNDMRKLRAIFEILFGKRVIVISEKKGRYWVYSPEGSTHFKDTVDYISKYTKWTITA